LTFTVTPDVVAMEGRGMHIISPKFEDIDEVAVSAPFGAIGVYVLWSPKAEKRPSYIGEGKILSVLVPPRKLL
jgi:hypothetical protein